MEEESEDEDIVLRSRTFKRFLHKMPFEEMENQLEKGDGMICFK